MAESRQWRSSDHTVNFKKDFEEFVEAADDFSLLLEHWIKMREGIIVSLEEYCSLSSLPSLDMAATIGKQCIDHAASLDNGVSRFFTGLVPFVGRAVTRGYRNSQNAYDERRVNSTAKYLKNDLQNTNDLEKIALDYIDKLLTFELCMNSCKAACSEHLSRPSAPEDASPSVEVEDNRENCASNHSKSSAVLGEISSVLIDSASGSVSREFSAFLDWAKCTRNHLQQFIQILKMSEQLCNQAETLQQRVNNTEEGSIGSFIRELEGNLRRMDMLRNAVIVRQEPIPASECHIAAAADANSTELVASVLRQVGTAIRTPPIVPECPPNSLEGNNTNEIDYWLRRIIELFQKSVEMAKIVSPMLFNPSLIENVAGEDTVKSKTEQ